MHRVLQADPRPTATRRKELDSLLAGYAEACHPGSDERARLEAWPELRRLAQQNWVLMMESYRSGQDVSATALWQLLPYKETPIAKSRGAFCHPAAAFRDDPRARFAGAGWIEEDQWPAVGRGLFEFVLRCDGYAPDLWQACEAFLAQPGGKGFTSGMLSPILNALKPDDFVVVNASGRAVLNHFWGCSLSASLADYAMGNRSAHALLAALAGPLSHEAFEGVHRSDLFEGFCHWIANTHRHPLEDGGVPDPRSETMDLDVFPTSLTGMRPIASELAPTPPPETAAAPEAAPAAASRPKPAAGTRAEPEATPAVVLDASLDDKALALEPPFFDESAEVSVPDSAHAADSSTTEEALMARCLAALERKGQIVLSGPPGCGKGRLARRLAARLVDGSDGLRGHIAFHAAWTYADFIQQQLPDGQRRLGRFSAFCRKAAGRRGCSVLVIEDLQRANVAEVLGEALVLLEQRGSEITLAGGGSLLIPPRVRLIATVDSDQDRGVLSDALLRQRFAFIPVESGSADAP
jgi:hypothetical protein